MRPQLHVDWSASGEWIVFSCGLITNNDQDTWSHLYIMRPDGSSLQSITGDEFVAGSPSWSPDGKWIAFTNRNREIVRIKPDSTYSESVLQVGSLESVYEVDWSPTENTIVYTVSTYSSSSIRLVNVDDKSQTIIASAGGRPARLKWSPNGELIAYADIASPGGGIYTIPKEGGKPTLILDYKGIIGDIVWDKDGEGFLLSLTKDQKPQLEHLSLENKALEPIKIDHFWGTPSLSPNGDWLAFSGVSNEPKKEITGYRLQIYKSKLDDTYNQRLITMPDCDAGSPQWIDFNMVHSGK